jgi:hypothetical protein
MSGHTSRSSTVGPLSDAEKESLSFQMIGGNIAAEEPKYAQKERDPNEGFTDVESTPGVPPAGFELAVQDNELDGRPSGVLSNVVSRVLSRASVKSDPGPPPDGGAKAWIAGKSSD